MELDASLQIDRVGFELPTGSIELLDRESNRLHSVQELRPGNLSSVLLLVGRGNMKHRGKDLESSLVNFDLFNLGVALFFRACSRISA